MTPSSPFSVTKSRKTCGRDFSFFLLLANLASNVRVCYFKLRTAYTYSGLLASVAFCVCHYEDYVTPISTALSVSRGKHAVD